MLTNCLAACAHLTISVSEIERDICEKKSSFYHTLLHSTPQLEGFPSEYRHPLWYGKTRMVSLPMVKKIRRYIYSFWRDPRTWRTDGRTDRHCVTAKTTLVSHRAVKIINKIWNYLINRILMKIFLTVLSDVSLQQARSQTSDNGGWVGFLRFWTFSGFENWSSQCLSRGNLDVCRAMLCISAAYAVMRYLCVCLSVCLSVCPSRSWILSKQINVSSIFFTVGSQAILVFRYQMVWQYSDGNYP